VDTRATISKTETKVKRNHGPNNDRCFIKELASGEEKEKITANRAGGRKEPEDRPKEIKGEKK